MRLVVSTMRLKPIAKNTVGGTTSFSSLIRNAERPDLGIADSSVLSGADNPGCSSKLTTSQQNPTRKFQGVGLASGSTASPCVGVAVCSGVAVGLSWILVSGRLMPAGCDGVEMVPNML